MHSLFLKRSLQPGFTAADSLTATALRLAEILMTLVRKLCVFICSCNIFCPLETYLCVHCGLG